MSTTPVTESRCFYFRPIGLRSTSLEVEPQSILFLKSAANPETVDKLASEVQFQVRHFNIHISNGYAKFLTKLALSLLPNNFLKAKSRDLTIYMASKETEVLAYIPLHETIVETDVTKITRYVGIFFKDLHDPINSHVVFGNKAKHVTYLEMDESSEDAASSSINLYYSAKAVNRAKIMDAMTNCRNTLSAEVWGRTVGNRGVKQIIFHEYYDMDAFDLFKKARQSFNVEHNRWRMFLDIARSLYDIHGHYDDKYTGYVHRDLKLENMLVKIQRTASCEFCFVKQVVLCDFDKSCPLSNRRLIKEKSGTIAHMSPEMIFFTHDSKRFSNLLGIDDSQSIFCSKMDTWTFGKIMFELHEFQFTIPCFDLQDKIHDLHDRLLDVSDSTLSSENDLTELNDMLIRKETLFAQKNEELQDHLKEPSDKTEDNKEGNREIISKEVAQLEQDIDQLEQNLDKLYLEKLQYDKDLENLLEEYFKAIEAMHAETQPPDFWPKDLFSELLWKMLRPDPRQRPSDAIVLVVIEEMARLKGVI